MYTMSGYTNGTSGASKANGVSEEKSDWGGRCRLPGTMISRKDFAVWTFLKQCIGKELSKITMPIIFNEPLSFLQRIAEYMEYAEMLKKASDCSDPLQRLELVTAFAVSAATSNWERVGKPFNPLLGETYELDREDLGFRIVCEQVSHHPPVSAFHADSPLYIFHGAIYPKLRFWGKSLEVIPKGTVTLHLLKHHEVYTWQNVNCCVHNIIIGKLWLELYGTMEVLNHHTNQRAVVTFKPCGWFAKDLHRVEGYIYDKNKIKLRALSGKWIDSLYSHDVKMWEDYLKTTTKKQSLQRGSTLENSNGRSSPDKRPSSNGSEMTNGSISSSSSEAAFVDGEEASNNVPQEVTISGSSCDLRLPGQRLIWQANPRLSESHKYYNFTTFALLLNELDDSMKARLAPTDCRLRPDMRRLEEGNLDAAAEEKNRLEEKQRSVRKGKKKKVPTATLR